MTRFSAYSGKIETRTTPPTPTTPRGGDFYLNTLTDQLFIFNSRIGQWVVAQLTTTTSTSSSTTTTSTSTTTTSTSSSTSSSTSTSTSTSTTTTL